MVYKEKLVQAIESGEIISFLRGDDLYKIEPSQYAQGAEPTDVGRVLSKAIYKLYEERPEFKEEFEKTLILMLDGTLFDVYVVILYIMSQLFREKNGLSPFIINLDDIVTKLRKKIIIRKEEFQRGLVYPNGFEKKEIWKEIERFNKVSKEEYEISLFEEIS